MVYPSSELKGGAATRLVNVLETSGDPEEATRPIAVSLQTFLKELARVQSLHLLRTQATLSLSSYPVPPRLSDSYQDMLPLSSYPVPLRLCYSYQDMLPLFSYPVLSLNGHAINSRLPTCSLACAQQYQLPEIFPHHVT